MGHRFSKTAANNIATPATNKVESSTVNTRNSLQQQSHTPTTRTIPIPNGTNNFVGPTINLQIQESPAVATTCCNTTTSTSTAVVTTANNSILQQSSSSIGGGACGSSSGSSSLTSVNNLSCGRQIIIKIQLAKMENGNEIQQQQHHHHQDSSLENITADCNLNSSELLSATNGGAAQILNLTLNSNTSGSHNMTSTLNTSATTLRRTAGSSPPSSSSGLANNNNYLNSSGNSTNFNNSMDASTMALTERLARLNTLQFNDEIVEQNIGEIVEYCEVLEEQHHQQLPPPIPPTSSSGGNNGQTTVEGRSSKLLCNAP